MPSTPIRKSVSAGSAATPRHTRREVLVIDDDAAVRDAIAVAIDAPGLTIHQASTAAEAQLTLASRAIDLCLIDVALPDADGMELIEQFHRDFPLTGSMLITGAPSMDRAVRAIQAGALDFVAKPIDVQDLNLRVTTALDKQRADARRAQRIDRLRKLCRQLNTARREISQQVDILCNDLVTAYQDLAHQMQGMELTSDLRVDLHDELDLEQVIRRTLEFIVNKVGPTNAFIFLPNPGGGYTVGGYVNYSHDKATHALLMQQLSQTVAPAIEKLDAVEHLLDEQSIDAWLGEQFIWLSECHVVACPCRDEDGEMLAAVMLERHTDEPFDAEHVELIDALCPLLSQQLVKVIGIHHRMSDLLDAEDDDIIPF